MLLILALACKEVEGDDPGECVTGLDEDDDGLIDCEDPDCAGSADCAPADTGDTGPPGDTGPHDDDGDGWFGSDDCDDSDPDVNPGASDPTVDGVDQDCDGLDGPDVDGDGYVDADAGGTDCDDDDAAVNPEAEDLSVDGADQNCDGVDGPDGDGDGYVDSAVGGTDCDDDDGDTHPGAAQIESDVDCMRDADDDGWGDEAAEDPITAGRDCDDSDVSVHPGQLDWVDGADDNCDGLVDDNGSLDDAAWAMFYGDYHEKMGKVVMSVPDRDGDGLPELLIGSDEPKDYAGKFTIVEGVGAGAQDLSDVTLYMTGEWGSYDHMAEAVGTGDFDGDGKGDVVTGGRYYDTGGSNDNTGFATILWGSQSGSFLALEQDLIWTGTGTSSELGETAAGIGDWDGDGLDDLALGEQGVGDPTAHLVLGSAALASGTIGDVAELSLYTSANDGWPGLELVQCQDLDGDGLSDWVVSYYYSNTLWIIEPGLSGTMYIDDAADIELVGQSSVGYFGYDFAAVGDYDGDGLNDLAVTEYRKGSGYSGGWWLVPGGTEKSGSVEDVAILDVGGTSAYQFDGRTIAGGDITGDGLAEVVVGSANTNSVSIYRGGQSGTLTTDEADIVFSSDDDIGFLGDEVAFLGDVSGDGVGDFAIAAWQKSYPEDTGEDLQLGGVTWVLLGGER